MRKTIVCGLSFLIAMALVLSAIPIMATTTIPHERYGQAIIDGSPAEDGYVVSAWIYGTEYETVETFNGDGSYQTYTPGYDPDDPTAPDYKTGGVDGETIIYRIDDGVGNIYIADETSGFEAGMIEESDLSFQTTGQPSTEVKINELVSQPGDTGTQYVYLYETEGITLADWRLDTHDGFSETLDALTTDYHPLHGDLLYVDLGANDVLGNDGGHMMLSWNAAGGIADNGWIVMDRVEYGNIQAPANTIHPEYPTAPGSGEGLVRDPWGHDTDNSANDFIIDDETGRPVMPDVELTVGSTEGGEVTDPGEGTHTYEHGEVVDLVAVADDGYEFAEWTGDVGTIDDTSSAETTITMNGDYSITAEFDILTYSLTVNTDGEGTVDVDPDQAEYEYGTVVTLTADPADDWEFVEWTGDASGTDTVTTVTMDDDKTVTAVFEEYVETYTLTVNIDGDGTVDIDPDQEEYEVGTTVTLTATPANGWEFVEWTGDASGTSTETTITMDGDKTVTAEFDTQEEVFELTIDSTSGGEVTEPGEGTFDRIQDTEVDLVAAADSGYEFLEWTGDVGTIDDTSAAETTITMNDDYSITAVFEEMPVETYTLTVNINGDGSVERDPDQDEYEDGTTVTLTAVPADDWEFVEWTGDASGTSTETTITMDSDKTVTAEFETEQDTFELTIDSTPGGEVTGPGEGTFDRIQGTEVDLVVVADENYEFVEWTGDIDTIADTTSAETTITMDDDYSITAVFETDLEEFDLTIVIQGEGTTDPEAGTHTHIEGMEVTITAIADDGWEFSHWSGDVSGTNTEIAVTMNDDKTVTAVFEEEQVPEEFDLTIEVDGQGTTDPEEGSHTYEEGTEVTITATAADGWKFVEWTGDATGTPASIDVTMTEDMTVTAVFEEDEGEPAEPGFLEDYWWLLLLLIIVLIVIIMVAMKRGKGEPEEEPDEEFDTFEEEEGEDFSPEEEEDELSDMEDI
ncbi:MAG: hypothetical protein R6U17_08975 [Thermoplasmata archaeon]